MRDDGLQIREYLRVLLQRKWLIAAVFLGFLGTTALFTFPATPMYKAETLLLIERTGPHVINIESVEGEAVRLGGSADYYNTQYQILASRTIASQVLDELGLDRVERFMGERTRPWSWLREWLRGGSAPGTDGPPAEDTPRDDRLAIVSQYLRQLSVQPIFESRLVRLYFESADPELAARIVNAHARAYIRNGLNLRTAASSEAGNFLEESIDDLQRRVEESQQALSEFRREHNIVSVDDHTDVVTARLASMNQRLVEAQAERIARQADLKMVRQRSYESLPAVINSQLIRTLKEDLAPLEREYAGLQPAVTPAYSGLRSLKARIEEARRRIDLEVEKIVDGIESDYLAANAREHEIRQRVEAETAEALKLKDDTVRYALLQQNVDTAMKLYESVRQRRGETGMVADMRASNVSVIDEAYTPQRPSSPRKAQNLMLGALIGLVGGIGLALLLEILDNRLRTLQEVEVHLRLPGLGVVPDFAKLGSGRRAARSLALPSGISKARSGRVQRVSAQEPPELVHEAYRSIRTDLLLSQAGQPPRTLLFSSAAEGEGKTTTVLNTAVMFAQLRVPVLLIDADLRKPRCHTLLNAHRDPGLTEVLTGGPCEPRRLQILEHELGFLPAGARPPNPTELLGSQRMREILEKLREQFEYILIDGPPLASVSDSLLLASMVDGVVLIADQQKTPRQALKMAQGRLEFVRAKVLGVVLNRADSSHVGY